MKNFKERLGETLNGESFSAATMTALVIAVVLVANTLLYSVFSLCGWQISPSSSVDFSVSGNLDDTMEFARRAGRKISVIFCYPEKNVKEHSTGGYVYNTAKAFEEKYPDVIELKFINIVTNVDEDGNFFDVSKYSKDKDGSEIAIAKSSVIFACGENFKVLSDVTTGVGYANFYAIDYSGDDPYAIAYNGEEVFASTACWVLEDEHKYAYFTKGHSEKMDPSFVDLLAAAGYNVGTIDLKSAEVPDNAALLIISNPKSDFEASDVDSEASSESDRLAYYLEEKGGNLLVNMNTIAGELPVLEGLLAEYGITYSYAENEEGRRAVNIVRDLSEGIQTDGYILIADYPDNAAGRWISDNMDRYTEGGVVIRDTAALNLLGDATALLVASPSAETFSHGAMTDSEGGYVIAAYSTVVGADGKEGKIVVLPSVYVASTAALITNGYGNKDFLLSVFEFIYGRSPLAYGSNVISFETPILEGLTMSTANVYTAIIMAVPVAVAVVGAVVLIRRKNR